MLSVLIIIGVFSIQLQEEDTMGLPVVDDTRIERYYLDATNETIERTYLFHHERAVDLKITNEINSTSSVRIKVNNTTPSTLPPATSLEQNFAYPASFLTVMNQLKINLTFVCTFYFFLQNLQNLQNL